ncbi:MAG TPA: EAL domain-containing protein [Mycobacteriales bacterium]|jgi:EAL domain-containing protein (putative c-di-GMP-specific phosphodiesterase class I)|nr:EAL domain-containing protein [Mycobacteriales bacterium]
MSLGPDVAQTRRTREQIEHLLHEPRRLGPDYAPICSMPDGALIGYKASGRGAPGTDLADTLSLLNGARSLGLVERLDWAFRALAIEDMLSRPQLELHLTPEPETYLTPCPPRLSATVAQGNRELRISAEVHEDAFAPEISLAKGIEEIRSWGWRIVLADVADHDHALAKAASIRPDVVQFDLRLAGRADSDEHHGVRRLRAIAEESGAAIMAVGVDSPSARERAARMGATLARGDDFGVTGALPEI